MPFGRLRAYSIANSELYLEAEYAACAATAIELRSKNVKDCVCGLKYLPKAQFLPQNILLFCVYSKVLPMGGFDQNDYSHSGYGCRSPKLILTLVSTTMCFVICKLSAKALEKVMQFWNLARHFSTATL
jgi:hypothetical protein